MIAALPVQVAHRSAVHYEQRSWGRAYTSITSGACIRVSRSQVRCPFSFDMSSSTSTLTIHVVYDAIVSRSAHNVLVWERQAQ